MLVELSTEVNDAPVSDWRCKMEFDLIKSRRAFGVKWNVTSAWRFSHSSFFWCAFSGEILDFLRAHRIFGSFSSSGSGRVIVNCSNPVRLPRGLLVGITDKLMRRCEWADGRLHSIELGVVRLMEAHFYTPHSG